MTTTHREFTAEIRAEPERLFELIADLPNYNRWLPGSTLFGKVIDVAPYPVCNGTSYIDVGPGGKLTGAVTECDAPRCIAFHQTMSMRRGPLAADLDIRVRYTLDPVDGATRVTRAIDLTIEPSGITRLAAPLVRGSIFRENARILAMLKRYAEEPSNSKTNLD